MEITRATRYEGRGCNKVDYILITQHKSFLKIVLQFSFAIEFLGAGWARRGAQAAQSGSSKVWRSGYHVISIRHPNISRLVEIGFRIFWYCGFNCSETSSMPQLCHFCDTGIYQPFKRSLCLVLLILGGFDPFLKFLASTFQVPMEKLFNMPLGWCQSPFATAHFDGIHTLYLETSTDVYSRGIGRKNLISLFQCKYRWKGRLDLYVYRYEKSIS